jgi:hypothetical protein
VTSELLGGVSGGIGYADTSGSSGLSGQTQSSDTAITYTGNAFLSWSRRNSRIIGSYSTGVFPSYIANPVPYQSHLVSLTGTQLVGDNFTGFFGGNYSLNTPIGSVSSSTAVHFESYGISGGVTYRVTPNLFLSLIENYSHFVGGGGGGQGSGGNVFGRNTVTFALTGFIS